MRNLVFHSKRRRPAGDVRDQIAEERIWVTVGGSDGTGENCIMRSFVLCTHSKYSSVDEIKENEVGGIYRTSGEQEK